MWIRGALVNAALAGFLTALPRPALTALSVRPVAIPLRVGARYQLVPQATAVASARLQWRYAVRDTTVAVVDSTGQLTVRRAGRTQVIVSARGEAAGFEVAERTATLTITVPDGSAERDPRRTRPGPSR